MEPATDEDVAASHRVVLDQLSAKQHDIIDAAIDDYYTACKPYSEAFKDIQDRVESANDDGALYINYQQEWYSASLSSFVA